MSRRPEEVEEAVLRQGSHAGPSPFAPVFTEGPVDRVCSAVSALLIVAMGAIIALELITRNLLGFSFQLSDEYGGYLLAALSFISLSTGHANGYFHRVTFVQARLPELGQALSAVLFEALSLIFCGIVLFELIQLERGSFNSGEVTSTILMTPLWIPQAALPIGAAALTLSVTRHLLANLGWLAAAFRRARG